jgi:hypothetical protein
MVVIYGRLVTSGDQEFCLAKNLSFVAQELGLGVLTISLSLMAQRKWRNPFMPSYYLLIPYLCHCDASTCLCLRQQKIANKFFPASRRRNSTATCHKTRPTFTSRQKICLYNIISGFSDLMVSMLASGTQDRGFAPGRSRRIFREKKSSVCLPS